jgi:hypothetical protein
VPSFVPGRTVSVAGPPSDSRPVAGPSQPRSPLITGSVSLSSEALSSASPVSAKKPSFWAPQREHSALPVVSPPKKRRTRTRVRARRTNRDSREEAAENEGDEGDEEREGDDGDVAETSGSVSGSSG